MEWIFDGSIIAETTKNQSINLMFTPVEEFLHNRQYTCRAVTSYGTLEKSVTISVLSEFVKIARKV